MKARARAPKYAAHHRYQHGRITYRLLPCSNYVQVLPYMYSYAGDEVEEWQVYEGGEQREYGVTREYADALADKIRRENGISVNT